MSGHSAVQKAIMLCTSVGLWAVRADLRGPRQCDSVLSLSALRSGGRTKSISRSAVAPAQFRVSFKSCASTPEGFKGPFTRDSSTISSQLQFNRANTALLHTRSSQKPVHLSPSLSAGAARSLSMLNPTPEELPAKMRQREVRAVAPVFYLFALGSASTNAHLQEWLIRL